MHVAIIGGGIGGAALALALRQRGVSFTLYEKDANCDSRAQGYGLTLQQGGRAVQRLGLELPGISSMAHFSFLPSGTLLGAFGRRLYRSCGGGGAAPRRSNVHLPRQALRGALLARVPPSLIRWGSRLIGLEAEAPLPGGSGGALTLRFAGGAAARADVVAGADGIWSVVRRLKLGGVGGAEDPCPLRYLGVIVILGRAPCAHPLPLQHVVQTLDGATGARLYAMPFSSGVAMWQLSMPMGEEEAVALGGAGQVALLAAAVRAVAGWHAPLPALIGATAPDCVTGYPVYDRDLLAPDALRYGVGAGGAAFLRVTLLGDAVHPMSPFKGQGANQALIDAVELADALAGAAAAVRAESDCAGGGGGGGGGGVTLPCADCGRSVASKGAARVAARAAEGSGGAPCPTFRCTLCARRAAVGPLAGPPGRAAAALASRLHARQQRQQQQQQQGGGAGGAGAREDTVSAALARFEGGMLQRAGKKAAQSRDACAFLHSPAACAPANCTRARAAAAEAGEEGEGAAGVLTAEEFEAAKELAASLLAWREEVGGGEGFTGGAQ
jgi:2-polyprenyl-6-methoxyphenol hydroxylase-like FAD-dependent oxidoreductase